MVGGCLLNMGAAMLRPYDCPGEARLFGQKNEEQLPCERAVARPYQYCGDIGIVSRNKRGTIHLLAC